MPNEVDNFDESDTTEEEFDAMWAEATPVETVGPSDTGSARGQTFWLINFQSLSATHTNDRSEDELGGGATVVPDTPTPILRPASTNVPQPA